MRSLGELLMLSVCIRPLQRSVYLAAVIINAGLLGWHRSMYFIRPPGEFQAVQTYCDMTTAYKGYCLASYGHT